MTSKHEDIEVSYSVSNDFFKLWLDEDMHYTSGTYRTGKETLEQAQIQKAALLSDWAEVTPDSYLLDIGCGWGSYLGYASKVRGVKRACGITLSTEQLEWCRARNLPNVDFRLQDFNTWVPPEKFDSIVSIEMVDHMVSPAQARAGQAVDIYRGYFKRVHSWMKPGTSFGFQAILRDRVPRDRKNLDDLRFTADVIFPGGLNPRIEELVTASTRYFEIEEMRTQRMSYRHTTAEWHRRLMLNEAFIRKQWGDRVYEDYDRYLGTCVRAFDAMWSSDVQFKLRWLPQ
jgi:cyclopropane-fatty-acyl-phospholipid synthase